jgi:hypothetical protein
MTLVSHDMPSLSHGTHRAEQEGVSGTFTDGMCETVQEGIRRDGVGLGKVGMPDNRGVPNDLDKASSFLSSASQLHPTGSTCDEHTTPCDVLLCCELH